MAQESNRNIRLGAFVSIGTALLIAAFYFVGRRENLFGSTFRVGARFHNVNGLMEGNSVRFAGIDVGTVQSLDIENDSTVHVILVLDKKMQRLVRKNAIATVGTDGLMGNNLVNINSVSDPSPFIEPGDELRTIRPLVMDEMERTLDVTNKNVAQIAQNLNGITGRISNQNTFWKVMMDTLVAENIQNAVRNLKDMTVSGKATLINFKNLSNRASAPRSSIGRLANDTGMYHDLRNAIHQLSKAGDSIRGISSDFSQVARNLRQGRGSLGKILNDSSLAFSIGQSIRHIDTAAVSFNADMLALQHSWLLKKYFRKKNK